MNNQQPPQKTYKAMLWDYDYLLTKSDEECCFSLSEREVQILLAQLDYIGWKTRYKPTSTEIDQDLIDRWMSNLARKLMTGCCGDDEQIHRYLPDGTYQSSDDDGVTWEDDPAGDPRHGAILAPPLPGSPSFALKCAAADNIRDQYEVMRDNTVELLTAGTNLLAIVAGLVAFIGAILAISVVGISFGVILFGLAAALLSLTPESVEEQIDDEALETFKCIVYCHLDNSGRVVTGEFDDILAEIASAFDNFPESFFYSITASMGPTGLNNAATMGVSTASDCEDCDCPAGCGDPALIVNGNVIESGVGVDGRLYLIVESNNAIGFEAVDLGAYGEPSPPNICCGIYAWVVTAGAAVTITGWTGCGGDLHDPGNPETHDVGSAYWASSIGAFTLKIIFTAMG